MLNYKGYTGNVVFDSEAGIFHGEVIGTRDVITFQGTSVDEIKEEFKESIEDYIDFCKSRGEEPEKPYSGKFVLRLSPEEHRIIATAASLAGKSINKWITSNILKEANMVLNFN